MNTTRSLKYTASTTHIAMLLLLAQLTSGCVTNTPEESAPDKPKPDASTPGVDTADTTGSGQESALADASSTTLYDAATIVPVDADASDDSFDGSANDAADGSTIDGGGDGGEQQWPDGGGGFPWQIRPQTEALACDGWEQWSGYLGSDETDDTRALAVATDACNSTYVVVRSSTSLWVNKYSTNGTLVWTSAQLAAGDGLASITVTGDGDPIVLLTSERKAAQGKDLELVQLDPYSGYVFWQAPFGSSADDVGVALTKFGDGFAVAGNAATLPWEEDPHDVGSFVTNFDGTGAPAWTQRFEQPIAALTATADALIVAVGTNLHTLLPNGEVDATVDLTEALQATEYADIATVQDIAANGSSNAVLVLFTTVGGTMVKANLDGSVVLNTQEFDDDFSTGAIETSADGLDVVTLLGDGTNTFEALTPSVASVEHNHALLGEDSTLAYTDVSFLADGRYVIVGAQTFGGSGTRWLARIADTNGFLPYVDYDYTCYLSGNLCAMPAEHGFPALSEDGSTIVVRSFTDSGDSEFNWIEVDSGDATVTPYYAWDADVVAYEEWAGNGTTDVYTNIDAVIADLTAQVNTDAYRSLTPSARLGFTSSFEQGSLYIRGCAENEFCAQPGLEVEVAFDPTTLDTDSCSAEVAGTSAWLNTALQAYAIEITFDSDDCSLSPRWVVGNY